MSISEYWQHLTSTALLGTERQSLPPVDSQLEPWISAAEDKETTLLNAAAFSALYVRSGQPLQISPHPPMTPAPTQSLPHNVLEARQIFEAVSQDGELWQEWLALSMKHQVPPPQGTLHKLLELGQAASLLRPYIANVIGPKGQWLARHLDIQWLVPTEVSSEVWEEGNLQARVAYLRQMRLQDPDAARILLQEVWKQENAEARSSLLESFRETVTARDEAFLETCLDDKSKRVRELAIEMLLNILTSALLQRMTERARPFLTYKPKGMLGLKKAQLDINLPEVFDKSWARDGIEQKNMPYGMGEKAWWLKQILERVPPSTFGEPAILEAASKEWQDVLRGAWRIATLRFADPVWARYFLPDEAMLRLLPLQERYDYVLLQLASMQGPIVSSDAVWSWLTELPEPWPPELEASLIKRVQLSLLNWSKIETNYAWRERQSLVAFGKSVAVDLLESIPAKVKETYASPEHPLHAEFRKMLGLLELRKKMYRYFSENRHP